MGVSYTGVVLDDNDQHGLIIRSGVHENELMADWEVKAHHLTICMGKSKNAAVLEQIGQAIDLKIVAFGSLFFEGTKGIAAVKVQVPDTLPVDNKVPHITLAHAPGVKPKQSNDIVEWIELPEPFLVTGIVQEVDHAHAGEKPAAITVREMTEKYAFVDSRELLDVIGSLAKTLGDLERVVKS